jgi:thermitase
MRHLHNKLCETSALYRKWHDHPSHPFVHWMLFALAVGICGYAFVTNVRSGYTQAPGEQQATNGPKSLGRVVGEAQDHVLVKFKPQADDVARTQALGKNGMGKKVAVQQIDLQLATLPKGMTPDKAVGLLKDDATVEYVEPDLIVEPSLVPNDPWYANWQNDKRQMNAPAAWDATTGASGQVLAVADTGVDCGHEDLAGDCVPGWNFYDNDADASDVAGHGTEVAGVAAAVGNNGVGVAGMTWSSKIMPLRVSAPDGTAAISAIASAITYAADHGAKVVNNSYQTGGSAAIRSAASYLKGKGGLLVVSEGNYGTNTGYDNSPDVISVGAVDPNDALYSWSSFGNDVDVTAPGCTGATTVNHGGYGSFCGTSNAAPETAGALMLVFAANPSLTPDQAQQALFSSAKDLGAAGWDASYGWGRVDAAGAIAAAMHPTPPPPPPTTVTVMSSSVVPKATSAVVTWTTDVPSTGVVRFGASTSLGLSAADATQGTSHSVTLTGLQKSTKYLYAITVASLDGSATSVTPISSFRTKAK